MQQDNSSFWTDIKTFEEQLAKSPDSYCFARLSEVYLKVTGGGLVSFAANRFQVLTPANGFPSLEVRSVLADPGGGMWAATAGGGLAHVEHGSIKTYTVADGLPTDQLTALARDRQEPSGSAPGAPASAA